MFIMLVGVAITFVGAYFPFRYELYSKRNRKLPFLEEDVEVSELVGRVRAQALVDERVAVWQRRMLLTIPFGFLLVGATMGQFGGFFTHESDHYLKVLDVAPSEEVDGEWEVTYESPFGGDSFVEVWGEAAGELPKVGQRLDAVEYIWPLDQHKPMSAQFVDHVHEKFIAGDWIIFIFGVAGISVALSIFGVVGILAAPNPRTIRLAGRVRNLVLIEIEDSEDNAWGWSGNYGLDGTTVEYYVIDTERRVRCGKRGPMWFSPLEGVDRYGVHRFSGVLYDGVNYYSSVTTGDSIPSIKWRPRLDLRLPPRGGVPPADVFRGLIGACAVGLVALPYGPWSDATDVTAITLFVIWGILPVFPAFDNWEYRALGKDWRRILGREEVKRGFF